MGRRLYNGFYKKCGKCKKGFHRRFNFKWVYIVRADDKYHLLTQQIKYYRKHGHEPLDEKKEVYGCRCDCGCGKELFKESWRGIFARIFSRG